MVSCTTAPLYSCNLMNCADNSADELYVLLDVAWYRYADSLESISSVDTRALPHYSVAYVMKDLLGDDNND